jgi:hypothetical protein
VSSNRHAHRLRCGALAAALVIGLAVGARASIVDDPLPRFSSGKESVTVSIVPGVVKRNRLQTDVLCTSRAAGPVDIGVELFDAAGTRLNDVGAGVGAVLDVQPLQTITIGTSTTLALLESTTIPLTEIEQGVARVVASDAAVQCTAMIVDDAVTPPLALGTLGPGVAPGEGAALLGAALPRFADGQAATHSAVFPGLIKRGRMETVVFCTSLAAAPADIGVEVFGVDGARLNDVESGSGALLGVAPGATVTIGTTGTNAFLESIVITLPGVSQGLARVVSTSGALRCSAQVVDAAGVVPATMSELTGYAPAPAPPSTATVTATIVPTGTATPGPTDTAMASPTSTATASPASTPTPIVGCTGDCNGNGQVSIDELVRGVNLALGSAPAGDCPAFDGNGDGAVTIDELVRAVTIALTGCVPAGA